MNKTKYVAVNALFCLAAALRAGARQLRAAATRLEASLARRRAAAAALHDFATMSDRELLDIGLTHVDVNRVAWGASDPRPR